MWMVVLHLACIYLVFLIDVFFLNYYYYLLGGGPPIWINNI